MVWIVALALTALNLQAPRKNDVVCGLAPYLGTGSSSEGKLDAMSGLSLACSSSLLVRQNWSFGPKVTLSEQQWTIYQNQAELSILKSYSARTLGLGLLARYNPSQTWQINYALSYAQGQGRHETNQSTDKSSQSLRFDHMAQTSLLQELSLEHPVTPRISLLAGVRLDMARQDWKGASGKLEQENVVTGNRLTLTNGIAASLNDQNPSQANYLSLGFNVGINLIIH